MKTRPFFASLLFSLLIGTLILGIVQPAETAQAAGCKNSGGNSRNFNYSSQVQGTVFTLCGKIVMKKLSKTVSKQLVKAKPLMKVKVKSAAKPKTKLKHMVKPKSKVTVRKSNNRSNGYASFRPLRPVASVTVNALKPNQQTSFSVDSKVHFRPSILLGFKATVRFTPTSFSWQFSDGFESSSRSPEHDFIEPGRYLARALVTFGVAYRFELGGSWVKDPGKISLLSNAVNVTVGENQVSSTKVYLVNQDCDSNRHSGITAIGCKP